MTKKLPKKFYQRCATELAPKFLGKYLVHKTPQGIISGMITDVEAYPAFTDKVSHGNKKTKRTEVMYRDGGHGYIYKIYGIHYQFAVTVNQKNIPEVVFIRAVKPKKGIDIMRKNFGKKVDAAILTKSPGNLCKSFGITEKFYGIDLSGNILYLEDRNMAVGGKDIMTDRRVGINESLQGSEKQFRYFLRTQEQDK
ncbi:DNA-3-methyladenine glycosylase [Patescibacteria group bacterium]|nr:DNA-3-methyladenine glycosylase [Patescibacteria group bacterium]MBU2219883.1 DNA-3-methyladenine glycosylase [Patescibacteria group bacterium]